MQTQPLIIQIHLKGIFIYTNGKAFTARVKLCVWENFRHHITFDSMKCSWKLKISILFKFLIFWWGANLVGSVFSDSLLFYNVY